MINYMKISEDCLNFLEDICFLKTTQIIKNQKEFAQPKEESICHFGES